MEEEGAMRLVRRLGRGVGFDWGFEIGEIVSFLVRWVHTPPDDEEAGEDSDDLISNLSRRLVLRTLCLEMRLIGVDWCIAVSSSITVVRRWA